MKKIEEIRIRLWRGERGTFYEVTSERGRSREYVLEMLRRTIQSILKGTLYESNIQR